MHEMNDGLKTQLGAKRGGFLPWVSIVIASGALALSVYVVLIQQKRVGGETPSAVASLSTTASGIQILSDGVLDVGYGQFPPYTMLDLSEKDPDKQVKGFSADLIREIAARVTPPLKIKWHTFSWDTLKAEVDSRRFDIIADPVFQTVPRAKEFRLSRPYSYFGIAVALVRKNDERFTNFQSLDREDIVIALAEGWTSSEYARKTLSKPEFKSIPVTGDALTQFEEVRVGRADVALNDVPSVLQYARAHPKQVKALWLDAPPSIVPGGFLIRRGNPEFADFIDKSIEVFITDGTLLSLDRKWKTFGYFPKLRFVPGSGLPNEISQASGKQ